MEQGIYLFSTGTYIDLDRILEIDPLEVPPYRNPPEIRFEFGILYMLQESRRRFSFSLMNQLWGERLDAISAAANSDDYKALLEAAIEEVQGKLHQDHTNLIEAWKLRKAQMSAFGRGSA